MYAGRIEIQQVMLKLLVNAAKAVDTKSEEMSEEKREISIRTRIAYGRCKNTAGYPDFT